MCVRQTSHCVFGTFRTSEFSTSGCIAPLGGMLDEGKFFFVKETYCTNQGLELSYFFITSTSRGRHLGKSM